LCLLLLRLWLRQVGFSDDCEEGVAEFGWMEDIPEEIVVGVGADRVGDRTDAWVGYISEAEVSGVDGYGLEEAEDVKAADTYALEELLRREDR
jgi:hypothetical protein